MDDKKNNLSVKMLKKTKGQWFIQKVFHLKKIIFQHHFPEVITKV